MAVEVGFEPTVAIDHTAFRVLHLRPLGHSTSASYLNRFHYLRAKCRRHCGRDVTQAPHF